MIIDIDLYFISNVKHIQHPFDILSGITFWTILVNDDVIKWKHFPRYWPFVRGIHRSPVNSPHKGQWGGALMFSLICAWINGWVNNREAGDLTRHRAHYDVTVMSKFREISSANVVSGNEYYKNAVISPTKCYSQELIVKAMHKHSSFCNQRGVCWWPSSIRWLCHLQAQWCVIVAHIWWAIKWKYFPRDWPFVVGIHR